VLVGVIVGVIEVVGVIVGVIEVVGVLVGVSEIVGVLVGVSEIVGVLVGVSEIVGVGVTAAGDGGSSHFKQNGSNKPYLVFKSLKLCLIWPAFNGSEYILNALISPIKLPPKNFSKRM
jgi:hypothetical protein